MAARAKEDGELTDTVKRALAQMLPESKAVSLTCGRGPRVESQPSVHMHTNVLFCQVVVQRARTNTVIHL